MQFEITTGQGLGHLELADLLNSVGWGEGYDEISFLRSINSYSLVAQARDQKGLLIGYLTAFSDGILNASIYDLVVRPDVQRNGIGRALLKAAEDSFPGIPIQINALGEAKYFFERCGYKIPTSEMTYMFKKSPTLPHGPLLELRR